MSEGDHDGDEGAQSFEEILKMLCPDTADAVQEVSVCRRSFSHSLRRGFERGF